MTHDHWTQYWDKGHLTSLPCDFKGNYDGEIAEFWYGVFDQLDEDATILDICTGNGALALLAADYGNRQGKRFQITGVDRARMNPALIKTKHPQYAHLVDKIHFIGNSPIEQFPLEEASWDLVMSQFGIEYTPWTAIALPIAKGLKENGRLAFLSHETTSDVITRMQQEQQDYLLLEPLGFYSQVAKCATKLAPQKRLANVLAPVAQALTAHPGTQTSPILKPLLDACQFALSADQKQFAAQQGRLYQYLTDIIDARHRLEDLLNVQKKLQNQPDWFKVFETGTLRCQSRHPVIYQGKHPVGTAYLFRAD